MKGYMPVIERVAAKWSRWDSEDWRDAVQTGAEAVFEKHRQHGLLTLGHPHGRDPGEPPSVAEIASQAIRKAYREDAERRLCRGRRPTDHYYKALNALPDLPEEAIAISWVEPMRCPASGESFSESTEELAARRPESEEYEPIALELAVARLRDVDPRGAEILDERYALDLWGVPIRRHELAVTSLEDACALFGLRHSEQLRRREDKLLRQLKDFLCQEGDLRVLDGEGCSQCHPANGNPNERE
jgi:hypothetical protein